MAHTGKHIERFAAHALGGRIGTQEFGVLRFQCLQFLELPVVFSVGNRRFIQHVVAVSVCMQLRVKFFNALLDAINSIGSLLCRRAAEKVFGHNNEQ